MPPRQDRSIRQPKPSQTRIYGNDDEVTEWSSLDRIAGVVISSNKIQSTAADTKKVVFLVGSVQGDEVSFIRSEVKRRTNLSVLYRKNRNAIRSSDVHLIGAICYFGLFSDEEVSSIARFCMDSQAAFGVIFDQDLSARIFPVVSKYPILRYKYRSERTEFLAATIADLASDLVPGSSPDENLRAEGFSIGNICDRIDSAAAAIEALRLNSTSEITDELKELSRKLRGGIARTNPSANVDIRYETIQALEVVAKVYDAIENGRLASLIVSGAVTYMITAPGWPAVLCQTVCLASWHGKDAFLAAIRRLPSLGRARKR